MGPTVPLLGTIPREESLHLFKSLHTGIQSSIIHRVTGTIQKSLILTFVDREPQQQIFSHGNISSPAASIEITKKLREQENRRVLITLIFTKPINQLNNQVILRSQESTLIGKHKYMTH